MMKKVLNNLRSNWITYGFETLVVLVGILGAFALNNWNETRQQSKSQLILLKSIQRDVETNMIEHQWDLRNAQISVRATLKLLQAIQNGTAEINDSLYTKLDLYTPYFSTKSAFDSFTGSGMEEISDDSLRYDLIRYYDFYAQRLTYWQTSRVNNPSLILQDFLAKNFSLQTSYDFDNLLNADFSNEETLGQLNEYFDKKKDQFYVPKHPDILSNPEFEIVLNNALKGGMTLTRVHQNGLDQLEKIAKHIEYEIDKLD